MLHRVLLLASLLTVAGILFPVLSLISGADKALLEHAAIVTWDTHEVQLPINKRLAAARLESNGNSYIPEIIPDFYNLHYLTLCSTISERASGMRSLPSTWCNSRWLDQPENLTQILLHAATKGLQDPAKFKATSWNLTMIDDITDNLDSIIVLDQQYDISSIFSAITCLFMGFALVILSAFLILFTTFIAVKQWSIFRTIPHFAMAFAALGATFLTISARMQSMMVSSLTRIPQGPLKVSVRSNSTFQLFQWSGALGMWMVVFLLWYGGVRIRRMVPIKIRQKSI